MEIEYRTWDKRGGSGHGLALDAVIELYRASTLGERRPVDDRARMAAMMEHANLVVTASDGPTMVGISRSLTDFAFCTYLSDLAVRLSHQRKGIGRELVRLTQLAGGRATVFLFSAPAAVDYYPRIGMKAGSGWMLKEGESLV
jgi:hypothetical protein